MKGRIFPAYIAIILVIMYIPIALVIVYSFNQSRLSSVWDGFTLAWYVALFKDRSMFEALRNSLILGLLSSSAAAIIGTLGASGMARVQTAYAGKMPSGHKIMEYLSILPIMIPEIIMA